MFVGLRIAANDLINEQDRKSISDYCFFFLNSLISWSACKQHVVSTSSKESEYYALTNTIKEAIWIRLFLSLMDLPSPSPFPIRLSTGRSGPDLGHFCWPWPWPLRSGSKDRIGPINRTGPGPVLLGPAVRSFHYCRRRTGKDCGF